LAGTARGQKKEARAPLVRVKDEAALFSKDAVEKADKRIEEFHRTYNKTVAIETFAAPPEGRKVPADKSQYGEFFDRWAKERYKDLGVRGVYVMICKEPRYVYTLVGRKTRAKAFTGADREKLVKELRTQLKARKFDAALSGGLDVIESALKANLK
jgi:hypothetical protein